MNDETYLVLSEIDIEKKRKISSSLTIEQLNTRKEVLKCVARLAYYQYIIDVSKQWTFFLVDYLKELFPFSER